MLYQCILTLFSVNAPPPHFTIPGVRDGLDPALATGSQSIFCPCAS